MNKQYLTEIITLFVVKEKRDRFLEFISSSKKYRDFLLELLNDPRNLNQKCVAEEFHGYQENSEIVSKLRKLGAGKEAYLISVDSNVDGKSGDLEEIISLVSGGGEIVYCLGTKLGYYEGHENWRYILKAD